MSNSKIVVLGCSFSKWINGPTAPNWPMIMSTFGNKELDIYNLAMYGNSVEFQVLQLDHILQTQECDFVIWQLPPRFRGTFLDCDLETAMAVSIWFGTEELLATLLLVVGKTTFKASA